MRRYALLACSLQSSCIISIPCRTFSPHSPLTGVQCGRRRFVFLQVEPDIWMVAVIVKETVGISPGYHRTTDSGNVSQQAASNATNRSLFAVPYSGPPLAAPTADKHMLGDAVSDATVQGMMRQLYDTHCLFHGTMGRVLQHAAAAAFIGLLSELRTRIRVLGDKQDRLAANQAAAAAASGQQGGTETASDTPTSPNGVVTASTRLAAESALLSCFLTALERVSPVSAVRRCLRETVDFLLHYTDWSHITPIDGLRTLRYHPPGKTALSMLPAMVHALQQRFGAVQHVSVLFDGHVVYGKHQAATRTLLAYLRAHTFHILSRSFEPDRRDYEHSSAQFAAFATRGAPARSPSTTPLATPTPSPVTSPEKQAMGGGEPLPRPTSAMAFGARITSSSGSSSDSGAGGGGGWSSAFSGGRVSLVDGKRWSMPVDVASLELDIAESLLTEVDNVRVAAALLEGVQLPPLLQKAVASAQLVATSSSSSVVGRLSIEEASMSGDAGNARRSVPSAVLSAAAAAATSAGVSGASANPSAFHRVSKPSPWAVPPLPPAVAAGNATVTGAIPCTPITVEDEWPVLSLPYVSPSYLASLQQVVEAAAVSRVLDSSSAAAMPSASEQHTDAARVSSSGALGLVWQPPPPAPPAASSRPTSLRALFMGSAAQSTAAAAASSSSQPEQTRPLFCPALFVNDTGSPSPSHRLVMLQQGLITVVAWVDAKSLQEGPSAASATPGRVLRDVDGEALNSLVVSLQGQCAAQLPAVETALADFFDTLAIRAATKELELCKNYGYDFKEHTLTVHGMPYVTRRPGKGRAASQACAVPAASVWSEMGHHLWVSMARLQDTTNLSDPPGLMQPAVAETLTRGAPRTGFPGAIADSHQQCMPEDAAGTQPRLPATSGKQLCRHVLAANGVQLPSGVEARPLFSSETHHGEAAAAAADDDGAFNVEGGAGPRSRVGSEQGADMRGADLTADSAALTATAAAAVAAHRQRAHTDEEAITKQHPLLAAVSHDTRTSLQRLWPRAEEHIAASRYHGVVVAHRLEQHVTMAAFDGTLDGRPLDGHLGEDMAQAVSRTREIAGLVHGASLG